MGFRIATDTGGTFTDLVIFGEDGELNSFKSSTTPKDIPKGIFNTIKLAADHYKMSPVELLMKTDIFIQGTTTATNAIIQGKTAKTGFITTKGFKDILLLREGGKPETFNSKIPYPKPYVPRYLTFEVIERINSEGEVYIPLNEDSVRTALSQLNKNGVEAIGICLLWSIVNPVHEQRIGEILDEEWPGIPYTLSHQLNPIIREYRRASSAVIDASLKPIITQYVENLNKKLRENGFTGSLFILTSFGGMMDYDMVCRKPIYVIGSGPSVAPCAGLFFGEKDCGVNNVIVCDTGGTSFDVSVIVNGNIQFTRDTWLGGEYLGHMTGLASVDVKSIGAGGGSIGWVDSGGLIHMGPQSAGADPGPACYMKGGKEPTLTDAAVVLGYINPHYFLGGTMKISAKKSAQAIEDKIAKPLDMNLHEAAFSMVAICNQNMVGAIQEITINQGIDPRESILVVGGGAGGLNIVDIAKEVGIKKLVLPKTAAVLSAMGGMFSDVVSENSANYYTCSNDFSFAPINNVLKQLEDDSAEFLSRLNIPPQKRKIEFIVEARYPEQVWQLDVVLRAKRITNQEDVDQIVEDFHAAHERVFAVKEPGQYIECIQWRARATGELAKPKLIELKDGGENPSAAFKGKREAYFRETGGLVETPYYDADKLMFGNKIAGPAVIEGSATTLVIPPGAIVTVSRLGSCLIELGT